MSTTATDQLAGTYAADKVHSHLAFSVKHMVVATFRGSFDSYDVSLTDGVLSGSVDVDSIVVKDETLAGHLKSPDFFDVEQYPQLTFRSTDIRVDGEDVVVDGEFTLKGVTKAVEARGTVAGPHEDIAGNTKLGLTLEATLDRTEFGLDWNAPLPKGGFALGNDVKLQVELELVKDAS